MCPCSLTLIIAHEYQPLIRHSRPAMSDFSLRQVKESNQHVLSENISLAHQERVVWYIELKTLCSLCVVRFIL
jgi:hypothetical protein